MSKRDSMRRWQRERYKRAENEPKHEWGEIALLLFVVGIFALVVWLSSNM